MDRQRNLDVLKIISAFMVVFYHFSYYKLNYGFIEGVPYIPNINRIVMCLCSCSVPIFFLVNGILIFRKQRSWKEMYLKAAKILLLLLVWKKTRFPGWFFKTLIFLYLLYPIFDYLYRKHIKVYYMICGAIFIMPFSYNLCVFCLKLFKINTVLGTSVAELRVIGLFTMYSILYFLLGPILNTKEVKNIFLPLLMTVIGWGMVLSECIMYTNFNKKMYDVLIYN